MNQCPIHYATMQESPTYHRSAIDSATTAIAEVHLTVHGIYWRWVSSRPKHRLACPNQSKYLLDC